jgi:hypothetical protein
VTSRRRTRLIRIFGALFVVAVSATLLTSFTASVNVPASKVGVNRESLTIAELTPTGCSSLALTSMVKVSGTFSNNKSHVLILGSSGADTVTDTGNDNCIVIGGGNNSVSGTSSDICIRAPGGGTTYKGCTESS